MAEIHPGLTLGWQFRSARLLRLDRPTQRQIARESGLSPMYISDIEAGKRVPPPRTIERLAAVLDLDAAALCWLWFEEQAGREMAVRVARLLEGQPS